MNELCGLMQCLTSLLQCTSPIDSNVFSLFLVPDLDQKQIIFPELDSGHAHVRVLDRKLDVDCIEALVNDDAFRTVIITPSVCCCIGYLYAVQTRFDA